jgi:flagellar hook-length control protein FliK
MNETETLNETDAASETEIASETDAASGPIPLQPVPATRVPAQAVPVQEAPIADTADEDATDDDAMDEDRVIEGTVAEDADEDLAAEDVAAEAPVADDVAAEEVTVEAEAPLAKGVAVQDARPSTVTDEGPLLADTEELRSDWQRVRGGFVDNPRASVAQAETVIDEAVDRLVAALRARQDRTRDTWDRDGRDTESLRQALLTYQALFNRITDL